MINARWEMKMKMKMKKKEDMRVEVP